MRQGRETGQWLSHDVPTVSCTILSSPWNLQAPEMRWQTEISDWRKDRRGYFRPCGICLPFSIVLPSNILFPLLPFWRDIWQPSNSSRRRTKQPRSPALTIRKSLSSRPPSPSRLRLRPAAPAWGRTFKDENSDLVPISHFSGPNSIPFHIQLPNSWFPISHFLFLTSHFSFLTWCKKLKYERLNYSRVLYFQFGY